MEQGSLPIVTPPPAKQLAPRERTFTLDVKCKRILQAFVTMHEAYGVNAVIHAIEQQGEGNGWFIIRGVTDPATGKPQKVSVGWPDPRRRTENMAWMGLFNWIDKGKRKTSGFTLNKTGYDFIHGRVAVRKVHLFRAGWRGVVKCGGPAITFDEITDSKTDREAMDPIEI